MERTKSSKILRVLAWVIGILVILGIAFQVVLNYYARPRLKAAIDQLVVKGSDSLYRYTYKDFSVQWLTGTVSIDSLLIITDSVRYDRLARAKRLPALTFSLSLPRGEITGIKLIPFLFSKTIRLDDINVRNAKLSLAKHFHQEPADTTTEVTTLYQKIQPDIKGIYIDKIRIANLDLLYKNADSARSFHWKFENGQTGFTDIAIDEQAAFDTTRVLYAKDFYVVLNEIDLKTGDGLYLVQAKKVNYSTFTREVAVDSFRLSPAVTAAEFYRQVKEQKDRYFLGLPGINIKGLSLQSLMIGNRLTADSVILTNPSITVYNDKTKRPPTESKLGKYPHQLLARLPVNIAITNLATSGGKVTYIEKARTTGEEGTIAFTGVRGNIEHITNDPVAIGQDNKCVIDLHSRFLGVAPLHAVFTFYLDAAEEGKFAVDADMGALSTTPLNRLLGSFTNIELQSFSLHQLHYHVTGNERRATGSVQMTYNDLKIKLMKDKDGEDKKKGLISFFANKLALFPDNPMSNKPARTTPSVQHERSETRSFFSLIWKTLLRGVEKIVLRDAAENILLKESK